MASDKILVHHDPSKPTRVYVDFSPCGVSATLAQQHATKWRPVIHVSRSLTPAESNYAQIEGESLAVFYGVTRLRRYLLGTAFKVVGDHKPLLSMYNMGRNGPMRVERHKLQLQGYTFIYIWEPGTTNPADYCSRHPDSQDQSSLDNDDELCVYSIITEGMPQALSIEAIKLATQQDTHLHQLQQAITNRQKCPETPALQLYTKIYDELTTENGVIVRGHRIVIPPSLYNTAIELSHTGHVEPTTTIAHLRERMWFPNLATIAQTYVEACFPCQAASPHTTCHPMGVTAAPPGLWHTLHMDYKGPIAGSYYVHVVIDAFSKFVSVDLTKTNSGEILLPILDKLWSTHRVCTQIVTDNGPPYSSEDFARYCRKMDINHNPTVPLHPQGNGLAENFMKKITKVVHTATLERKDPRREVFKMVLMHNATKHATTQVTLASALMCRDIKTLLPSLPCSPPLSQHITILNNIAASKERNKVYHNKHRHAKHKSVHVGDLVLIKQQKPQPNHPGTAHHTQLPHSRAEDSPYTTPLKEQNKETSTMSRYLSRERKNKPQQAPQQKTTSLESPSATKTGHHHPCRHAPTAASPTAAMGPAAQRLGGKPTAPCTATPPQHSPTRRR